MEEVLKFKIFEIKQFFLREIPHPKLILKQINTLAKKGELGVLDLTLVQKVPLEFKHEQMVLVNYLNVYIQETLQLKQAISKAASYESLQTELVKLYGCQLELLKKLASYLPTNVVYPNQDIKMSASIDAYQIIKRIQQLNLEENGINAYLCQELENTSIVLPDVLTTACLRAEKILSHD